MRRLATLATVVLTLLGVSLVAGSYDATHPQPAYALDNGLTRTPPMGFNDWNAFGCNVSEQLIKDTADLFVSTGLKDAGYQYVNIDDCWMTHSRDPQTGRLVPDPVKFPDGIAGTADYVHAKGLKLGIYEDAGTATCAGYPGSLGHEAVDAQTFADWGVDYLKYDNCNNAGSSTQEQYIARYSAMRDALAATGRSIVYSLCEWGVNQPWTWGADVGNLWRTTGDIGDNWNSLKSIISQNMGLSAFAKPGAFNDPDMLEIGNGGMTDTEYRTHFAVWALMAAPLLIGTDLRRATPATMEILTNTDIIAVDQDPLGKQAAVLANENGRVTFAKPLSNGDVALGLYNSTDSAATMSTSTDALGLGGAPAYRLKDLWSKATTETAGQIAASVPPHATVIYRVSGTQNPAADAPAASVTVQAPPLYPGATTSTVNPGADNTITTTFSNTGRLPATAVAVALSVPSGWQATPASAPIGPAVPTDKSFSTQWTVRPATATVPGTYTLTATGLFSWGEQHWGSVLGSVTVLIATRVPAGTHYLSDVTWMSASNFWGPVEKDRSNGEQGATDGHTMTIGGVTYAKGLGAHAPGEIDYYTAGGCTSLRTDAGIDDEKNGDGDVTFQIWADDRLVAQARATWQDAPIHLTADVTGAQVVRLVLDPNGSTNNDHADWAGAQIVC